MGLLRAARLLSLASRRCPTAWSFAARPAMLAPMCGRIRLSSDVSEIKARLLDPSGTADPELPTQLERRANRSAPGGPI